MSDPGEYQRTFLQHEKQIRENKFVEAAQSSRKLCVQLEEGTISGEWDVLAGVDILSEVAPLVSALWQFEMSAFGAGCHSVVHLL